MPFDCSNRRLIEIENERAHDKNKGTTTLANELAIRLNLTLNDLDLLIKEFETITENKLIKSSKGYIKLDDIKKHLK